MLLLALAAASAYLLLALLGSCECLEGTCVGRLSIAATDGACGAVESAFSRACGARGAAALAAAERRCCGGPSPLAGRFGQAVFLSLVGGVFSLMLVEVIPLLPLPGIPAWHLWTGTAATMAALAAFLAVCASDPGVVARGDAAAHAALYPHDGVLFAPRACATCGASRPARSKHCRATGACVARYDHWCLWINNAVGLLNTRWFLLFLAMATAVATYATLLAAAAIAADVRRRRSRPAPWRVLAQIVAVHYRGAAGAAAFSAAAAYMVAGFLALHLWRVATGVTTNEAFKWRELRQEAGRGAALPRNAYDRGVARNFAEVLFPRRHLREALERSRKGG
jgi:hypothetical protein